MTSNSRHVLFKSLQKSFPRFSRHFFPATFCPFKVGFNLLSFEKFEILSFYVNAYKNFSFQRFFCLRFSRLFLCNSWFSRYYPVLFSYFPYWIIVVRGLLHIESSQSLRQNDTKFQTHPPTTLHVKMPNLSKIDVYNFGYKINVGILMKISVLPYKCMNK